MLVENDNLDKVRLGYAKSYDAIIELRVTGYKKSLETVGTVILLGIVSELSNG